MTKERITEIQRTYNDVILPEADVEALCRLALANLETQEWLERLQTAAVNRTPSVPHAPADTKRGITDCSTPLFQRVRNIVEQLECAEVRWMKLKEWITAERARILGGTPPYVEDRILGYMAALETDPATLKETP